VAADGELGLARSVADTLFQRRIILLGGTVGHVEAGNVAASLMALDALGDEPIELRLNARSDSLEVALTLIDTVDVLGVRINATVAGVVEGTLAGVLAVCNRRRIGRLGRVVLREPFAEMEGSAAHLSRQAEELDARLLMYTRRLASATGRPLEWVEADLQSGTTLSAEEALLYGLVDEILGA
jgi:ATP-dependent Clp protease protease subunit